MPSASLANQGQPNGKAAFDVSLFVGSLPEAIFSCHRRQNSLRALLYAPQACIAKRLLGLIFDQTEACDLEVWTALSKSLPFGPLTAVSILKKASANAVASDQPS
jgi:hypothetical protein